MKAKFFVFLFFCVISASLSAQNYFVVGGGVNFSPVSANSIDFEYLTGKKKGESVNLPQEHSPVAVLNVGFGHILTDYLSFETTLGYKKKKDIDYTVRSMGLSVEAIGKIAQFGRFSVFNGCGAILGHENISLLYSEKPYLKETVSVFVRDKRDKYFYGGVYLSPRLNFDVTEKIFLSSNVKLVLQFGSTTVFDFPLTIGIGYKL